MLLEVCHYYCFYYYHYYIYIYFVLLLSLLLAVLLSLLSSSLLSFYYHCWTTITWSYKKKMYKKIKANMFTKNPQLKDVFNSTLKAIRS